MSAPRPLTLQQFAERLAATAGCTKAEAQMFLTACFGAVGETLRVSRRAETPIGIFEVSGEDVLFTPDAEIASAVNEPFAVFSPVKINNPAAVEAEPEPAPPAAPEPEPVSPADSKAEPAPVEPEPEPPAYQPVVTTIADQPQPEPEPTPGPALPPVEPEPVRHFEEPEAARAERRNCLIAPVLWMLFGLVVGAAGGFFYGAHYYPHEKAPAREVMVVYPDSARTDTVIPVKTTAKTEAKAPDKPAPDVLDTVRAGYYITHMAKKYYGNREFWSYIYQENADKLGDPDLTQPGTIVVIPDTAKYGINPADPESVRAARKLGAEIYSRYR